MWAIHFGVGLDLCGSLPSQNIFSVILIPGQVRVEIILEAISKHIKVKKEIGISQHEFIVICLTNPTAFYHIGASSVGKG